MMHSSKLLGLWYVLRSVRLKQYVQFRANCIVVRFLIEVEISSRGVIKVKSTCALPLRVWSVEFIFKSETSRIEEGREKRIEVNVRDSVKLNRVINSGEEVSVDLGVPIDRLQEVTVYYSVEGRFFKKSIPLHK